MFQCGLLPPVREDSEFAMFDKIFIDIGDEQSIDNDLSTYTSKLYNLKFFIENIDAHSLFLIDELGTGTDPSLGGAIAEATLEALNSKEAMGVVTTHYSNLKLLAGREQGIVNGAMLYDIKKLKPLFQLKIGKPGSSFALEIAHEIGFPEQVLKNAKEKTGKSQLDFDRELQNLEVEKHEITQKSTELKVADDFLAELINKYEKLNKDLEIKKKEILDRARDEARQLLDNSNKIIEKTIKEIRESQADKIRTKEVRAELSEMKEKILKQDPPDKNNIENNIPAAAKITSNQIGSEAPPHRFQSYFNDLHEKLTNFSLTLDLRGKRVDETISLLQRFIDDAILLSIPEVQILHGKGNGILRQVTRDYLRSQKEVKSAKDAPIEQGGAGITVVHFRK
jgi:DNA mismatch repair protein MutS2